MGAKDSGSHVKTERLRPEEVQQVQFRRSFRGYDEQEVDDFLDRVTDELATLTAEIRALRDQSGTATAPLAGGGDLARAASSADEIVRKAREEADAIVREARVQTGGGTAVGEFVIRERGFLERLAKLVQEHADGVKRMAQAARAAPGEPGQHPSVAPPPPAHGAGPPAPIPRPEVVRVPEAESAAVQSGLAEETGMAPEPEPPPLPDLPPPPRELVEAAPGGHGPEGGTGPGGTAESEIAPEAEDSPTPSEAEAGPRTGLETEAAETERTEIQPGTSPVAASAGDPGRQTVGAAATGEDRDRRRQDRETSLRELFWGEE